MEQTIFKLESGPREAQSGHCMDRAAGNSVCTICKIRRSKTKIPRTKKMENQMEHKIDNVLKTVGGRKLRLNTWKTSYSQASTEIGP